MIYYRDSCSTNTSPLLEKSLVQNSQVVCHGLGRCGHCWYSVGHPGGGLRIRGVRVCHARKPEHHRIFRHAHRDIQCLHQLLRVVILRAGLSDGERLYDTWPHHDTVMRAMINIKTHWANRAQDLF